MTTIFLVGGIKGGIGKSLAAQAIIHFLQSQNKSLFIVDSDREVKDISDLYKEATQIEFSEDLRRILEPNQILEIAHGQSHERISPEYIVVNLPGSSESVLRKWLADNNCISQRKAPEGKPQFLYLFLMDGTWKSYQLLLQSLEHNGQNLPHVLLKNNGRIFSDDSWDYIENKPEYQEAISKYSVLVDYFPRVSTAALFQMEASRMTLAHAERSIPSWDCLRIRHFNAQCARMFDRIFKKIPQLLDGELRFEKVPDPESPEERMKRAKGESFFD